MTRKESASSTLVYVTVLADQPIGVRVNSIEGRSWVRPGESVAYPVTEREGLAVSLLNKEDK